MEHRQELSESFKARYLSFGNFTLVVDEAGEEQGDALEPHSVFQYVFNGPEPVSLNFSYEIVWRSIRGNICPDSHAQPRVSPFEIGRPKFHLI